MNHHSIIETLDPEIVERMAPRAAEIRNGASTSSTLAAGLGMASVPVAIAVLAKDVFAQSLPAGIVTVLNFALTLEYLESTFYQMGLANASLIPGSDLAIFQQISKHETDHVATLKAAIGSAAIA